ncbi:type VI secretion system tube protein TssD [uncultured Fibrella sp.]|uniref:type VI secretion system tube protein TssD n=1 Tax=uncultured Fibrella sp. TaxID=1284596 RepID=UPI0035CC907E
MASFAAYLSVGSSTYRLYSYDLAIQQETDSLGRPSSATQGGVITCTLDAPNDGFLHQWMFSPTMQADGKLVLMQESPESTLKTISFFNAYCVNLDIKFRPGAGGAGSFVNTLRISPQRVAVGAIVLDNNWPLASHGAGETFQLANYQRNGAVTTPPKPRKPPICDDIAASTDMKKSKKERYNARLAVIDASSAKLKETNLRPSSLVMPADATRVARTGQTGSNQPADTMYAQAAVANKRFELNNRAIERAKLTNAIYLMDKKKFYENQVPPQPEKFRAMLAAQTWPTEPGGLPEGWEMTERSVAGEEPVYMVARSTFEKDARPVLVFRGTDNAVNAQEDWKTNLMQGNGLETRQYNGSINLAKRLARTYNVTGGIEIAGHSKAGGQAAAAGILTGAKTYTFNAAGVHPRTISREDDGKTLDDAKAIGADGRPVVDAFNFPHDVLNNIQDTAMPMVKGGLLMAPSFIAKSAGIGLTLNNTMPIAAGVRHIVPAQTSLGAKISSPWNPMKRVEYHGMPYLIDSMEKQKKDDLKTLSTYMGCQ